MKHRVKEIDGALLDAAVAQAYGYEVIRIVRMHTEDLRATFDACLIAKHGAQWSKRTTDLKLFNPSRRWEEAGPIIEHYDISIQHQHNDPVEYRHERWHALWYLHLPQAKTAGAYGPTPLVAAMRTFVIGRLGDEIELPDLPKEPI